MNIIAMVRTALVVVLLGFAGSAMAERLPVGDFFKDPEFTSVSLSPDGKHIAFQSNRSDTKSPFLKFSFFDSITSATIPELIGLFNSNDDT